MTVSTRPTTVVDTVNITSTLLILPQHSITEQIQCTQSELSCEVKTLKT